MTKTVNQLAITATTQAVRLSTRHAWFVILAFLLVAILSAAYFASHFAITTDSNKLLSSSLTWRKQEGALDRAFPWRIDQIIAVVDAATPEAAEEAANTLADDLSHHAELFPALMAASFSLGTAFFFVPSTRCAAMQMISSGHNRSSGLFRPIRHCEVFFAHCLSRSRGCGLGRQSSRI